MQGSSNNQDPLAQRKISQLLYCRLALSLSVTIALASHIAANPLNKVITLILVASFIIYNALAHYFSKRRPEAANTIAALDGIVTTITIAELHYSLWPSLTILAMLYLHSASEGGRTRWLMVNLGVVVGLILGFFAFDNQTLIETSNNAINIPIAIGALIYVCIYALYNHQQVEDNHRNINTLNNNIREQKLQAYELSRYIPKPILERIEGKKKTKIERKPITIFFSDIVGFSSLSEELEAETLSAVLSSYLNEMSEVVGQFNGTIDKFIGDAIMVTFGDDTSLSQGVKQDAVACVSMALAMGKRMRELQPMWAEMGIRKPLQIRIGINSGYCTVGTFGTTQHMDHTALGVHVNLASRLESAGQPEEILVSHETWNLIKDTILCKDRGKIKAKGFTHPVQVFQVINHRKELGSNQSYFSETTDGFSMHLDMQKVKNYDREKVIACLEVSAKKLRDRFNNLS